MCRHEMQSNATLLVNYSNQEKLRFFGAEQTLSLLLASVLLVPTHSTN